MTYVKIQGGQTTYPYSIGQLRKDNPNTSFPKSIPESVLESYGVYSVVAVEAPTYNVNTQRIEQNAQPTKIDDAWLLEWTVSDLTTQELELRAIAKATETRTLRDRLLAATDWTANSDVTMSDEMRTYRQALRDVPSQAGFPHDVAWPDKP